MQRFLPRDPVIGAEAAFRAALGRTMAALSDGSMKVGIQGWDGNRWRLSHILPVIEELDRLAVLVIEETGALLAPVDVWGGGQVSQPPRFLGEDPFENLARMKEVGPNLRMKCIYRGRQAFGFLPCSDEIQRLAIHEAAAAGVQVFRIFDPLCDTRNLRTAIAAVAEVRARQLAAGLPEHQLALVEGLVFHVRPPAEGTPLWLPEQTLATAIELARAGCHEIALSDYAGQLDDVEELGGAIRRLRRGLDEAGLGGVRLGFLGTGHRPELVAAALRAGAEQADVSLGVMAGGISSAGMRQVAELMMAASGFDMSSPRWRGHPVWRQLLRVEAVIDEMAAIHTPYRLAVREDDLARMARSRLAFNAVSALHSAIDRSWTRVIAPSIARGRGEAPARAAYFDEVLAECERLWVRAGQPHMVSPFGFILSFQAEVLVRTRLEGRPPALARWRADFRAIVLGRFGRNLGVERGACDRRLVDCFRILAALEALLAARADPAAVRRWLADAGLAEVPLSSLARDPRAEELLMSADVARVEAALGRRDLGPEVIEAMRFALSPAPFPAPTEGLESGRRLVAALEAEGLTFAREPAGPGRLDERDRAALMHVLFKVDESDPYKVGKELARFLRDPERRPRGDIEPDTRPVDALLRPLVQRMGEVRAKERILAGLAPREPGARARNAAGLLELAARRRAVAEAAERALREAGFSDEARVAALRLERGLDVFARLHDAAAAAAEAPLRRVPPPLWREGSV